MEDKKRMVQQIVKFNDGTETVINYKVDEVALQAVEKAVEESVAESGNEIEIETETEAESIEHVVSQEDVDNNPDSGLVVGDVVEIEL